MDNNAAILIGAVVVAVASVIALRFLERMVSIRLGPTAQTIPDNIQSLITRVSTDMQAKHKTEIAELRSYYEAQLAISQQKIFELESRVNWLFAQLVAAGGKVPDPMPLPINSPPTTPVAVLGIWPSSGLSIRAEIDAIFRSGIKYEVLDSHVSKGRLLAEVDRMKPTILHVGAHANEEGVMLDDGIALVGWWKNLAALYPFSLCVLNACESLDIVDAMHDAGVQSVVGMRKEISDTVAVEFARQFYGWLLRGRTVQSAVTLAKLGLKHTDAELIVARGDWGIGQ